jgi:RNA polymerase sigma-70 factor (ECF subfamily)
MTDPDVDAIRRYFTLTAPPPRGHHYFTDLRRRIDATTDTRPDRAPVLALPEPRDQLRWEQIAQHRDRLVHLARRRTATREDAEDVASEAILRCMTFDGLDPERVEQFLTTVTIRLCADSMRSQRLATRRVSLTEEWSDVPKPGPEDAIVDRAEVQWLLAQLPARQRSVVTMYASGLAVSEIARRHAMTYKATESALSRARAAMRLALAAST